jgi:hypothetical protein
MWPGVARRLPALAPNLAPSKFLSIANVKRIEHKAGPVPAMPTPKQGYGPGIARVLAASTNGPVNGPAGNPASSALHGLESERRQPGSATARDTRAAGADVMPPDAKACQDG